MLTDVSITYILHITSYVTEEELFALNRLRENGWSLTKYINNLQHANQREIILGNNFDFFTLTPIGQMSQFIPTVSGEVGSTLRFITVPYTLISSKE